MVDIKEKSVPLEMKLQATWGSVVVEPQVFTVMEANNDTIILGRVTSGLQYTLPSIAV